MRKVLVRLVKVFIGKLEILPPWLCPSLGHLRSSSLLGPASVVSTSLDKNIVAAILSANLQGWKNGEIPTPKRRLTFEIDYSSQATISEQKPLKLSIVMSRHWPHNGMETDLWVNFSGSAAHAGHSVSQFDFSKISYDDNVKYSMNHGKKLKADVEELREFLLLEKPDIVVFDGNFIPRGRSISREAVRDMKSDLGFKLCTIIGDLHDLQP